MFAITKSGRLPSANDLKQGEKGKKYGHAPMKAACRECDASNGKCEKISLKTSTEMEHPE